MKRSAIARKYRSLAKDCRGSAAMEFAAVAPMFLLIVIGTIQLGLAYYANAGLRNAVEIGARYAVIYPNPTDSQIVTKIRGNIFGLEPSSLADPTLTRGTANGTAYVDISMSYSYPLKFIFIPSSSVTLSYSRRAYMN